MRDKHAKVSFVIMGEFYKLDPEGKEDATTTSFIPMRTKQKVLNESKSRFLTPMLHHYIQELEQRSTELNMTSSGNIEHTHCLDMETEIILWS